ncbi:hypothetical protein AY600_20100 [Phormidium willei BDU 130791]|nr:hypothetical protein AY600_20100 [Phormidium willei BDU 130791]
MSGRRLEVLVVDDDRDLAEELAALVTAYGHRAAVDHDGQSAFAAVHGEVFDLILMDINMPLWDGTRAAEAMGSLRPDARIVLMSGDEGAIARAGQGRLPVVTILTKPLDPAQIRGLLAAIAES